MQLLLDTNAAIFAVEGTLGPAAAALLTEPLLAYAREGYLSAVEC